MRAVVSPPARTELQRGGQRLRHQAGFGDLGRLEQAHAVTPVRVQRAGRRQGEPGLAHAPGADQAHQALAAQQRGQLLQRLVTADERGRSAPGPWRRCRRRRGPIGGRRARWRAEAVAAPRDGGNDIRPQHLAQRTDLDLQVVLLLHHAGPDPVQQFLLADDVLASFDKHSQHLERTRAERHRPPIDLQAARRAMPFADAEAEDVLVHAPHHRAASHGVHVHDG